MFSCRMWRLVVAVCAVLLFTACGKGSDSGSSSGNNSGSGTSTNQQQIQAAETTAANNAQCTSLTPFYWEIGDKDGALANGTGGAQ
ncbi:MAG: hypothetical protein ACRETO_00275 [Gammaproteobacteria bacterium]